MTLTRLKDPKSDKVILINIETIAVITPFMEGSQVALKNSSTVISVPWFKPEEIISEINK